MLLNLGHLGRYVLAWGSLVVASRRALGSATRVIEEERRKGVWWRKLWRWIQLEL